NPPYLYGPLAETHIHTLPAGRYDSLSTDLIIYRLLTPEGDFPVSAAQADVRDIAHAHVLALSSPLTSSVGRKRILIGSPHGFNSKAVIELIKDSRPELQDRLTRQTPPSYPYERLPIDFKRVEEVLGMTKDEFRTVEDMV
ncbi:hypothetical protein H0H93_002690, partial [Arthromyces matolae]